MAAKTQQIFELLQDTTISLSDYKHWTDFLKTAAWQYKYPFEDQVLIHAQRPDATACAKIEVWNNSMHRWINRGAKGIALLREDGNRYGLEYVFDVSDTNDRYNRDVRLWRYDERYDDAIIETLGNTFGDLKVDVTVSDAILCAAHNAVADNKADYLHELKFVKSASLLRGLDDVNLDLRFRQTAEVSIVYMVMQRMGITQDMFDEYEFQYIQDFNTPETMNILGNAVSSISETALRSISETIRAEQKREKFAYQQNNVYNRDETNNERNDDNGRNSIQDERRLSDTRTDSTDGGTQNRQIRNDEENIPQGTPPEPVHNTFDEGRASGASGGDRQDSDRASTESGGQHGESGGRDGDNEIEGFVEMDGFNEQLSPFSRGDRAERAGIQLSLFDITLPSEEEQRNMIERAEQTSPAFSIPQQIVDEVLTTGGNDRDSILKICVQYSKNKSAEDNIAFLKKEYGTGGKGFQFDNSKVSVWWEESGMRIAYGDRAIGRGELITWDRVDKRIGELLEVGRFAPQEILDGLNEFERKTAATNFYEMYRDCNRDEYPELREYFNTEWFKGSYPDTVDNLTELFKQPENVMAAIATADALNVLYADDENIMRFRWYSPDKVLPLLQDLRLEHKTFISDKTSRISPTFITEDEIDKMLIGSTKYSTQKIETYLYFKENTDAQERIKFLKNRYGIGGGASGVFWNKHDAKGISFSRSDIFSPFAKVTLPWNKVEKRIDSLIIAGKYLTEREINEDIPRYQSEQEQQRIKNEKYMYLHDMDKLSDAEKRETLPKRIQYFIDIAENYEKGFFREYGVEHLLGKTEIVIAEAIRDNETRRKLSECMNKIGGSATDVLSRNCGYKFAEELKELKVIDFHKVGDFYEMYGDEAVEAEKVLETTLTRKQIDGEYVAMTGIPAFAVERYAELLGENGYIVNFRDADRNEPLARAQILISEFCEEEYGDIPDFGDLSKIGIAHTTTEDDLHTIQVNADLIDFTISRYIDNQLVDERRYNSLQELIENELAGMTFDDLVYFTQEQLAPFYEENTGKEYELGFGKLGNGTTVWNRLEEENHDYKTVAHISDNGEVKYYEDLPDDVKQIIEEQAAIDKAEYEERRFRDTMYDVAYTEIYRSMSAYNELKEHNPESLIIIQVGSHYETLGDDADIAGQLWDSYMLERQLPGSEMKAAMTGFTLSDEWQLYKDILTEAGYNVLVASDMSDDGTYRSISRFPAEKKETEIQQNNIIGRELTIDDRKFVVERVGEISGNVTLHDITFENSVGFPISRVEKIDTVLRILETQEQNQESLIPHIEKTKPAPNTVIYPDIPMSERHNFRIKDDNLGHGTPTQKYERNIEAIKTLKKLENQHRLATPEEQEILSQYVGWGGLADCFDERNSHYSELKLLLTPDEYSAARESTLTAFYTPPLVIRSIYKALENMGLKQGNILDPAMGVGNFEGMLPDSMSDCKMYGIELDSISGRIAQQLYQKNAVTVQGYEDTTLPDSFFDGAIGNVPFANVKVLDRKYNKHKFLIHDYFFAKTLDKVRPGGVVAFITSSGTMDKKNSNVRKYIAQRADLIGAIRLPDNTFKANAGTEVTSDILFLQKRDRMTDIMPEWINLGTDENGNTINQYFVDNPDMILGDMIEESGPFGMQLNCKAYEGADLEELLDGAIQNIHAQITEYELDDISNDEDLSIAADPNVKNFSYTVVDGDIYFRENSRMNKVDVSLTAQNRIKGMIEIRDCVKELIEYQTEDYPDSEIKEQQAKLNRLYDDFTAKYGLINSRGNNMAFSSDSSYFLLCSLEVLNDNGELERKADMFTKRTIGAKKEITHVDTASEALAVSLGEKARIDMEFMSQLTGKTEQELFEELKGVIFLNPLYDGTGVTQEKYLTADEYLSGNVREKLEWAKRSAELYPEDYTVNVEALTAVQPKDLTAAEITVRLGTTWIPPEYIKEFTFELLTPSYFARRQIDVHYSRLTGNWNVSGKSSDRGNVKINSTYGTHRINALKIIEDTLNLRDVRIFDYKENEKGNKVPVLNSKETTIAQQKQEAIKAAFDDWIWKNPERREHLTRIYNEKFNSFRTREYDGSHITFSGMNPEIQLRQHQKNAVARIMYGGNSLLGHVVGAGKTWTMAAAAMESKRLGLCNKPLFVVPNHLTEQWASEFLQLYPAANILVTTKKDFETKNRKKFCGRIATGDYDAIIIGHSQFEKIPMSSERQEAILRQQLNEILDGIAEAKSNNAERFTIKQMERTRKSIEAKIKKLNDTSRKDDVVTFEELGVDRMFVDEGHHYKNLFLVSKMRNVGGIAQTDAQKSSDMFMKCRYLDELTGGKGNIFATGTPISNSMVELYTMQRYLQYDTLAKNDLQHFDAWASTFGETVTAIELAPEGTGYRAKTRFAKFYNIPELMTMFREVADIQTADMLKLPVPEAEYHNVAVEPTEIQREMVAELGNRAETVRNGGVDPTVDNMLKITNDGRKLALDQRLMNDMLPDEQGTKVAVCADNVFDIWKKTSDFKGTQLVFCDSSTPKKDGSFNVYDDIHDKLISKGVPESDIAFIHDADSDIKKKELFAKVRRGDVRILLGSTQKMGAGTNVQTLLYAAHDIDCPWRPSDLEQRAGRIIRQGNTNEKVHIYRYVTKDTFDSYSYQLVENKQKFISQIMTSKSPVRSAEDIDETALSYAEIKALATGNPHIKEKMELDTEVAKLKLLKSSFMSQKYELEDKVIKYFPQEIKKLTEMIAGAEKDIVTVEQHPKQEDKFCPMTIDGLGYYEKEKAGNALIERCKAMTSSDPVVIGEYRGFTMILSIDTFANEHKMTLQGSRSYTFPLGADVFGNIQRIDNALGSIEKLKAECEQKLTETKNQFEIAKVESKKDFPKEAELAKKTQRLAALDALLNIDKREPQAVDMVPDEGDMPKKKNREMER